MFYFEQRDVGRLAPGAELSAIRIPVPANTPKQGRVSTVERDQIAAAAMIGAEDEPFIAQLGEGDLEVVRHQHRAIAPDRDDLVVTHVFDGADGVLEARCKTAADLAMEVMPAAGLRASAENMHIRREFVHFRPGEEREQRRGQRAPREIGLRIIGKDEDRAAA